MRPRQPATRDPADVNMTPMLDIVFILLIFFIVTSTFIQEDALGLETAPIPESSTSLGAIIVDVDANNLVRVNGRLTGVAGVRAQIERLRAENPDTGLVILAHSSARTGTVVRLRDIAYSANFDRVNIFKTDI